MPSFWVSVHTVAARLMGSVGGKPGKLGAVLSDSSGAAGFGGVGVLVGMGGWGWVDMAWAPER
jgi:hypothetical protein